MSEERIAKNIDQLIGFWKSDTKCWEVSEPETGYYGFEDNEDGFKNIIIDFDLYIPSEDDFLNEMEKHLNRNVDPYKFKNCVFKKNVSIHNRSEHYIFAQNCSFENELKVRIQKSNLTLFNCSINTLNFENAVFGTADDNESKGKCRLQSCSIVKTKFRNATFHGLVDLYNSTFIESVNFYKTDFLNIVVFSATVFKSNVLFTYSLFNDVTIFRGTKFRKGLDLSLAIIKGNISVFDIPVRWWWWEFRSKKGILTELEYEKFVSGDKIPVKNKRETFRILKKHYENVNNIGDSVSLAVMEKNTLFVEIISNIFSANKNKLNWFWFMWGKLLDFFNLLILTLNAISNWHKSSYVTGILFTGIVGILFFNLSISYTHISESAFTLDWETMKGGFKYYLSFLNPTHNFDYLGENILKEPSTRNGFYLFDYLGRIFVGYGIYQTIQAFRKFR